MVRDGFGLLCTAEIVFGIARWELTVVARQEMAVVVFEARIVVSLREAARRFYRGSETDSSVGDTPAHSNFYL